MTHAELLQEYSNQKAIIAQLAARQTELEAKLEAKEYEELRLNELVARLREKLYGRQSEKRARAGDPIPLDMFELPESAELPAKRSITIAEHKRTIQEHFDEEQEAPEGTFPEHLPREEEIIDEKPAGVAEEDLEVISEKVTERLKSYPERHVVRRIVRLTYKQKSTKKLYTAPAPEHVLDKRCKVDETFLVLMVYNKFLMHLPLYRQQQELKLQGINISRDRLITWTIQLAALLKPIAQAICSEILKAPFIHCDETPIVVGKKKENDRTRYGTGYLWPILAPDIGVGYHYRPTRGRKELDLILNGYNGTIVSDAYSVYESYVEENKNLWQLCWMHIRRKFYEAQENNKELSEHALDLIAQLYRIEKSIKYEKPEKRTIVRQEQTLPILNEFRKWLEEIKDTRAVITSPSMSEAVNYVYKRWQAACLFAKDGAIPIDNGADERALRPAKLGAKNWLHCTSETGAETVAIFYTLIHSAMMHKIHPYYYLLDLCKRLDDSTLSKHDLTPLQWKKRFHNEALPEHLHI